MSDVLQFTPREREAGQRRILTTIGPYGPHVRVITRPAAPPSSDLVVQWKDKDGKWNDHWRTNDMSNDFAHTEAAAKARALRALIVEGELR